MNYIKPLPVDSVISLPPTVDALTNFESQLSEGNRTSLDDRMLTTDGGDSFFDYHITHAP